MALPTLEPTPATASTTGRFSPDLTEGDRTALAGVLRETIERDRFPLSPRIRELKPILEKVDPPRPAPAPYAAAKAWVNSSIGRRKR